MSFKLSCIDMVIMESSNNYEAKIEDITDSEVMYYLGEIRNEYLTNFRNFIEHLKAASNKDALSFILTTPGGSVEAAEKMVEILRHHFEIINFIVPEYAMSAGTILCMSGDKIYMDYFSSLGPIDPQVLDKEGKYMVPALGHLDKVEELIEKSKNGNMTHAEFAILKDQDLATLRLYEQARDLSVTLIKKWLVKYKFKNENLGGDEKENKASKIADKLANNNIWHSHGRLIGMETLKNDLQLEIEDLSCNEELHKIIRAYSDPLSEYMRRQRMNYLMYNRKMNR